MINKREILLAEQIIHLDLLRDELYEELQKSIGCKTHDFLRSVQNRQSLPEEFRELNKEELQYKILTSIIHR